MKIVDIAHIVVIACPAILIILSICLYAKYGIKKIEDLSSTLGCAALAIFIRVSMLEYEDEGNWILFGIMAILTFAWFLMSIHSRKIYNETVKKLNLTSELPFYISRENPTGYFLVQLSMVVVYGLILCMFILLFINYTNFFVTGEVLTTEQICKAGLSKASYVDILIYYFL